MSIVKPERFRSAPVRVVLYFEREVYDKLENAAKILGSGTVEALLRDLADHVIEDLESQGYDLRSNWLKKVVGEI